MDATQAQISAKNTIAESFSLNPSALISFYEIDIQEIAFNNQVVTQSEIDSDTNVVFKFHNNVNLTSNSLFWRSKEYIAAPIEADGFEINVRGSTPIPRLRMSVSDLGIPALSRLKERLNSLGDIVGAKVTRIRTYSRFLDAVNFLNGIPPLNFFPDPNSELARDIYYIDRKSNENKNLIEYELAPLFELEGIRLPGRIVSQDNCPHTYRGEGCLYEYASRKDSDIHGDGVLPQFAPPVATSFDEPINVLLSGVAFSDKGDYNLGQVYNKGDFVNIKHRGIRYYFVSKIDNNSTQPPDSNYWISDACSKKCKGCKLRWQNIGEGILPFGGFLGVNRSK